MPEVAGPYSPYREAGDLVFVSGQIGIKDGKVVDGGLEAELNQALANMTSVLESANLTKDNVVKATIFMNDMADYAAINEIYLNYFDGIKPARSAVAVREIPLGAVVEIEVIACRT